MTKYTVTFGYKAILDVSVRADSEKEARELAIVKMKKLQDRIGRDGISISDDRFKDVGILDMDATYNSLYK